MHLLRCRFSISQYPLRCHIHGALAMHFQQKFKFFIKFLTGSGFYLSRIKFKYQFKIMLPQTILFICFKCCTKKQFFFFIQIFIASARRYFIFSLLFSACFILCTSLLPLLHLMSYGIISRWRKCLYIHHPIQSSFSPYHQVHMKFNTVSCCNKRLFPENHRFSSFSF